jgi:hypothetical protein
MHLYKVTHKDENGTTQETTVAASNTIDARQATGQDDGTVKEIGEALPNTKPGIV